MSFWCKDFSAITVLFLQEDMSGNMAYAYLICEERAISVP